MREALRRHIWEGDASEWSKLARAYNEQSVSRYACMSFDHPLDAQLPEGMAATRAANGEFLLTHPDFGTGEVREALRRGLVQGE